MTDEEQGFLEAIRGNPRLSARLRQRIKRRYAGGETRRPYYAWLDWEV